MNPSETDCYLVLSFAAPAREPRPIAVLLFQPQKARLLWRFLDDYSGIADPDDAEVLAPLTYEFVTMVRSIGAEAFLARLEDTLSNALRISERIPVAIDDPTETLDRLFEEVVVGRAARAAGQS